MITYLLIHRIKRTVLLETSCSYLLQAYIDQKVPVDQITLIEVLIHKE